jgi:hypothetical protein
MYPHLFVSRVLAWNNGCVFVKNRPVKYTVKFLPHISLVIDLVPAHALESSEKRHMCQAIFIQTTEVNADNPFITRRPIQES